MNVEDIRAELTNRESWKSKEVEAFYTQWWIETTYYKKEKAARAGSIKCFTDAAKILGRLTDEEIMRLWVQYLIEKEE